jgi:hypothetical protein
MNQYFDKPSTNSTKTIEETAAFNEKLRNIQEDSCSDYSDYNSSEKFEGWADVNTRRDKI